MVDECKGVRELDPVQGLVDYVLDIKPYHTKVIEILVEYVQEELVDVTILEDTDWVIDVVRPADPTLTTACDDGYSELPYGGTGLWPILSPNQAGHNTTFPLGFNVGLKAFTVPGDRSGDFIPGTQIEIVSFVENYEHIFDIVDFVDVGSPITPYTKSFVILDPPGGTSSPVGSPALRFEDFFSPGNTFETLSTAKDDNRTFTISAIITDGDGPNRTIVEVNQAILSTAAGGRLGMVRTPGNNTGTFTIVSAVFSAGTIDAWPGYPNTSPPSYLLGDEPHTVITVQENIATPQEAFGSPVTSDQTYVAFVRLKPITIEKVLSYSDFIPTISSSPLDYENTPDEGISRRTIVGVTLSTGSPLSGGQFVVAGNWEVSNLFPGDKVRILQSTGNNGLYTISSISYDTGLDQTTLTVVESVLDATVDGIAEVDIPANVFIIDGNFTSRFVTGELFNVIGGTYSGSYTTLTSDFVGGKTRIRTTKEIIDPGTGFGIRDVSSGFHIAGDHTGTFTSGTQFNVVGSKFNDGAYTVSASLCFESGSPLAPCGSPDNPAKQTVIIPNEPFVPDASGEIHFSQMGVIKEKFYGFGETADICDFNPEGLVRVKFHEQLILSGAGIELSFQDDIVAYNLENNDGWSYELPINTIFQSGTLDGEPEPTLSGAKPATGVFNDLWLNTTTGVLHRWVRCVLGGSPPQCISSSGDYWRPITTAYWLDTDTNLFYYRTITADPAGPASAVRDTGWVLYFALPPGFAQSQPAVAETIFVGQQTFFVGDEGGGTPQSTFTLDTLVVPSLPGSPAVSDETLIQVFINGVPANFTLDSSTQFTLLPVPYWDVGDIVTAKVFDRCVDSSSPDVKCETNADVRRFSHEPHSVFHQGVEVYPGSPERDAYLVYGGNYIDRFTPDHIFDVWKFGATTGSPVAPSGLLATQRAATIPIVDVDVVASPDTQTITVEDDWTWLFTPGRVFNVRTSGNNTNDFVVESSTVVVTPVGSPVGSPPNSPVVRTIITVQQPDVFETATTAHEFFSRDLGVIVGAVYENPTLVTNAGGTPLGNTDITIVAPTTSVQPDVDGIIYTWVGPLRMNIELGPFTNVDTTMLDGLGASNELLGIPDRFEIIETDAAANTIRIHHDDPVTGLPINLSDSFTPGTTIRIAGSFGEGNPASQFTNDAEYVVKSVVWDSTDPFGSPLSFTGTGDTIIEIDTDFANVPPFNTLTVISISNNLGSPGGVPQIVFAGDVTSILQPAGFPSGVTPTFIVDAPIVDTNPLLNELTVTSAVFAAGQTTVTVDRDFIDTSFTGALGIIDSRYRADIFYDDTNAAPGSPLGSPILWEDGYILREAFRIDTFPEHVAATRFLEDLDFGWGTTHRWAIIGTNAAANTIFIAGDITSILDVNDRGSITGSFGNDGEYEVVSFSFNISGSPPLNRTEIVLRRVGSPSDLPTDTPGSPALHGYFQLENIDITSWFQYLIKEVDYATDTFIVHGNATGDVQSGQQFRVFGNTNTGLYTVSSSPIYDPLTNTTDIPVVASGSPSPPLAVTNPITAVIDANTIRVTGNINILDGDDQIIISGSTLNDGTFTVQSLEHDGGDTLIVVVGSPGPFNLASTGGIIEYNDRGGWIESFRDYGIRIIFTDSISATVGEDAQGAVLQTGGPIVGAWDYPYWDIGSWDESLGTVIHLYSNTP